MMPSERLVKNAPHNDMDGSVVSHYQILEKLGEGGMGMVYKARDLHLPRVVVLKFLARHLCSSHAARQRFIREANAIASLNHVNIATLYEFEASTEEPFLVLEFLPGGTLHRRILASAVTLGHAQVSSRTGGLAFSETLEYALQISAALAYAHQKGIVHRDVKPSNVLFAEDGRLKITDFGLSKLCGSPDISEPGIILGTPQYMSPEQVRGEPVDERTDIFSLGMVFYEMAAGQPPFGGERQAVRHQIQNVAPAPLRERNPELPEAFERIVAHALEKDRRNRYQGMTEVLDDLRSLRRGAAPVVGALVPESTETIPGPQRPSARKRMWRPLWYVAGAAGLLMALLFFLLRPPPVPPEKRIAVLPFRNIGGDATGQAFCDGLMEILTSKLTQLERFQGRLWVVPASEVRGQSVITARQARAAFGVNLAITGSLQRTGSSTLITVSLLDAKTQRQLRSFDDTAGDVSFLQDALATRVASILEVELQPRARQLLAEGRTPEPAAYDFYVQGYGYLRRYGPAENADNAIRLFQQALDRDPNYALACAGLGEAYWQRYKTSKDTRWVEQAREWTRRAVKLNDRLAPVHVALGLIQYGTGKYADAIHEYQRALELNPDSADAYSGLADAYETENKVSEAEATYKRAIQLNPSYWAGYSDLGAFYARYARYLEAEQPLKQAVDLAPDNPTGYRDLGGLLIDMGQYDKAISVLQKSPVPTGGIYSNLGTALFDEGRYRDSVAYFEKAIEVDAKNYLYLGNLADAYRWAPGFSAKAPETYRRAIREAQRELAVNPGNAGVLTSVAVYEAKLGDRRAAQDAMERALQLAPGNADVAFQSVLVYELTGDRARALTVLESTLKTGYSFGLVGQEPELAHLRDDPRYRRMLQRLHLASKSDEIH
jgi:tetratricopeptide (TPR) repeat protein